MHIAPSHTDTANSSHAQSRNGMPLRRPIPSRRGASGQQHRQRTVVRRLSCGHATGYGNHCSGPAVCAWRWGVMLGDVTMVSLVLEANVADVNRFFSDCTCGDGANIFTGFVRYFGRFLFVALD